MPFGSSSRGNPMHTLPFPRTPWLLPEEHEYVVHEMLRFGLLKFGKFKTKSGLDTDIYINLRDARNNPKAIEFIVWLFSIGMRRLDIQRFVEIPDSVSCFAGPLAQLLNLPFLTIREQAKEGRVTNAKTIGAPNYGDKAVIIDDVITDGESKIAPFNECLKMGLNILGLVVLVDRQQGWQKHLAEAGIKTNVWCGMTLHDVRYQLIHMGLLERCAPEAEEMNPIILALDGKSWDEILPTIDRLRSTGTILKVNDLAIALGSDWLLPHLSVYGRVMYDIKSHDIKNTVGNICRRLLAYPPWAVTLHASGAGTKQVLDKNMISEAVEVFRGTPTKVLAVTVLTSIDSATCKEVYNRLPVHQVRVLAKIAFEAGAHGLVCSPEEVGELSQKYPDKDFVVPGIRSAGADMNDQSRVGTPLQAIADGASYLVMGREIFAAADPIRKIETVQLEVAEVLMRRRLFKIAQAIGIATD
jgi:orotidine-5'-phosphate decarboxylase